MADVTADARATSATLEAGITATMIALAGIPSVSGQEGAVREYVRERLKALGLTPQVDAAGNLIARVPAQPAERDTEPPMLLNAHMDRVPPGRRTRRFSQDGILSSDGTTNLGADDSAGIAIILHTVEELRARDLPHPPLLLLFTVGEEVGLIGAKAFDPAPWGAREGIVFDNAGEAGVVVTRAATYHRLRRDAAWQRRASRQAAGRARPAPSRSSAARAIPSASWRATPAASPSGASRAAAARNAVPRELRALGEARTLLEGDARERLLAQHRARLHRVRRRRWAAGRDRVRPPLRLATTSRPTSRCCWPGQAAVTSRGEPFRTMTTFIGSDASALRPHTRVFTVSTGAMDEHTSEEWIALAPLAELIETAITLLSTSRVT